MGEAGAGNHAKLRRDVDGSLSEQCLVVELRIPVRQAAGGEVSTDTRCTGLERRSISRQRRGRALIVVPREPVLLVGVPEKGPDDILQELMRWRGQPQLFAVLLERQRSMVMLQKIQ